MHAHAALLTRFYEAFQKKDHATMAACYHADARFSDPVFTDLRGADIGAMWRMLCERGEDLTLTFSGVDAGDETGTAHWEPVYSFGPQKRRVHNVIDASFRFRDGLIVEHRDHFDFYRWSRQALGVTGVLLGWTPFVRGKVQQQAARGLRRDSRAAP